MSVEALGLIRARCAGFAIACNRRDGSLGVATSAGKAGALLAGVSQRFDVFARLKHRPFPDGRWLRTPARALGRAWYRLKDPLA